MLQLWCGDSGLANFIKDLFLLQIIFVSFQLSKINLQTIKLSLGWFKSVLAFYFQSSSS